ncbi:hypothetical protein ETAA8_63890 [Anatilimnocola aggregata]|uniref:Uncharacterized protein n=2 Tax=Anatilimnocola aggregata TaxID=2528021 RepID=A0A517YLY7_9BACT|nr:hypothetical protein ETAA8_63890 [Anatilimnocola aggregata]
MTPAQMAVHLICGLKLPPFVRTSDSIDERMNEGRARLVKITGKDFGYDLQAWHDDLKVTRANGCGYTYGRNIALPKIMKGALGSREWQAAATRLTHDSKQSPGSEFQTDALPGPRT